MAKILRAIKTRFGISSSTYGGKSWYWYHQI